MCIDVERSHFLSQLDFILFFFFLTIMLMPISIKILKASLLYYVIPTKLQDHENNWRAKRRWWWWWTLKQQSFIIALILQKPELRVHLTVTVVDYLIFLKENNLESFQPIQKKKKKRFD
jgi:hypothetical protein